MIYYDILQIIFAHVLTGGTNSRSRYRVGGKELENQVVFRQCQPWISKPLGCLIGGDII